MQYSNILMASVPHIYVADVMTSSDFISPKILLIFRHQEIVEHNKTGQDILSRFYFDIAIIVLFWDSYLSSGGTGPARAMRLSKKLNTPLAASPTATPKNTVWM
jgi:hypothetical protein